MPMHSNLKLGYSNARRMYFIVVVHDFRYQPARPLYFETREERREFINDYSPPEPEPRPEPRPEPEPNGNGDEEPSNNGEEPILPAIKTAYRILALVVMVIAVAYILTR